MPMERTRARRIAGRVAGAFTRSEPKGFVTRAVSHLDLGFVGIEGDVHAGATRLSGGREPWYPRRTEIRNERQISILSPDELAAIAQALDIDEVRPEWLGANLLLEGIANLTWLPPRTLLAFEGGATIRIDGDNAPCRASGRALAAHVTGRPDLELGFAKAARNRRGLVGWVEKPGRVTAGTPFEARLPPQWIYA